VFSTELAPTAKFLERYLALHFFLVLLAQIINAFALLARELDESVLGHNPHTLPKKEKPRKRFRVCAGCE